MSYEYSLDVFSEDEEVSVWIYIATEMKQEKYSIISTIMDRIFINHNSHSQLTLPFLLSNSFVLCRASFHAFYLNLKKR
jgi:hypothetical protein